MPPTTQSPSSDTASLTRILARLSPKILSTDPHSPLRHSPFERTKTAANLEYARTLLLRAEHEAAGIKAQQRKHATQAILLKHRSQIKTLNDRLFELGQLDDGRWASSDESENEGVDELLRAVLEEEDDDDVVLPRTPVSPGKKGGIVGGGNSKLVAEDRSNLFGERASESSGLRARGHNAVVMDKGTSTGHSLKGSDTTTGKQTTTTLESAEVLHADLTSSLVGLATQLKLSAQAFSDDLALDAQQLGSTEEALGKNKSGLDVATQRMGVLRRMSEGRWWWGRMVLYAGIGALWVVLILLVFIGPKIRF